MKEDQKIGGSEGRIIVANSEWSMVNGGVRWPFAIRHSPFALLAILTACGSTADQPQQTGPPPAMAVQIHVLEGSPLDNAFTTTGSRAL